MHQAKAASFVAADIPFVSAASPSTASSSAPFTLPEGVVTLEMLARDTGSDAGNEAGGNSKEPLASSFDFHAGGAGTSGAGSTCE